MGLVPTVPVILAVIINYVGAIRAVDPLKPMCLGISCQQKIFQEIKSGSKEHKVSDTPC